MTPPRASVGAAAPDEKGEILPSARPVLATPLLRAASGQSPAAVLSLLSGPVGEAVAKASGYAGKALSENTRRAYATDWALFSAWCEAGGVPSLPAEPLVIAGYLVS